MDALCAVLSYVFLPLKLPLVYLANNSDFVGRVYGWLLMRLPLVGFTLPSESAGGSGKEDGHDSISEIIDDYSSYFYWAMIYDTERMEAYKSGIELTAARNPGKCWLDIGTGRHLPLTRIALATGKVKESHAIEGNSISHKFAQNVLQSEGLASKVQLHLGMSNDVTLPNGKRADIIVHELIGSVASDEGMIVMLDDACKRLLAPGGKIIPERVSTICAPVEEPSARLPLLSRVASYFYNVPHNVPSQVGSICSLSADLGGIGWLAESQMVEDYDYSEPEKADYAGREMRTTVQCTINRAGALAGIYLAPHFQLTKDGHACDALKSITNWGVVFVRLASKANPYPVKVGDVLEVTFDVNHKDTPPEYTLHARIGSHSFPSVAWKGMVGGITL